MPPEKDEIDTRHHESPGSSTRDYPSPSSQHPQHIPPAPSLSTNGRSPFAPSDEEAIEATISTTAFNLPAFVNNMGSNHDQQRQQLGSRELQPLDSTLSASSCQEIFQASLTFANCRVPLPVELERRVSSGGKLYPTISAFDDSNMDSTLMEESWKAAAKPARSTAEKKRVSIILERDELRQPCRTSSNSANNRHEDDDAVMWPSGGLVLEEPSSSAMFQGRGQDARNSSARGTTPQTASLAVAARGQAATLGDFDDSGKAFASAMYSVSTFAAAARAYDDYGNTSDQGYAAAAVRYQEATAEDEELIALKRAAYGGYGLHSTAATISFSPMSDQEAEATVVEYDIHYTGTTIAGVQAELIGHDFSTAVDDTCQVASPPVASAAAHADAGPPSDAYEVMESTITTTTEVEEEAAEATVIESGPLVEKEATAEAWSSSLTEEASVLHGDTTSDTCTTGVDLDSKPPAVNHSRSWRNANSEEAEVMGITDDAHPSEWVENEAQAELIGTDSNFAVAIPSNPHRESSVGTTGIDEMYFDQNGVAGEQAEIIGLDEAAQARVIEMDSTTFSAIALSPTFHHTTAGIARIGTYGMEQHGEEAEVMGITEDFHPSEAAANEAQAELIMGTDSQRNMVVAHSPQGQGMLADSRNIERGYDLGQDPTGEEAAVMGITEPFHPSESNTDESAAQVEICDMDSNCALAVSLNGHISTSAMVSYVEDYIDGAVGDGEAQVVGITEDFHPSEYLGSPRAELMGIGYQEYSDMTTEPGYFIERDNSNGDHAEIVGITEEFHPAEVLEGAAEAELIGGNSSFPIGAPQVARHDSSDGIPETGYDEQATIVADPESTSLSISAHLRRTGGDEVEATLIVGEFSGFDSTTAAQPEATATSIVDGYNQTTATTITTVLQESYEDSSNLSYSKTSTPLATVLPEDGHSTSWSGPRYTPSARPISVEARAVSAPAMMSPSDPPNGVYAPDGQRIVLSPAEASIIAAGAESSLNGTPGFPPLPSPSCPTAEVSNTSGTSVRSGDTLSSQNRGGLQAVSRSIAPFYLMYHSLRLTMVQKTDFEQHCSEHGKRNGASFRRERCKPSTSGF
jgi:hypothetical protein